MPNAAEVTIKSNVPLVKEALEQATKNALEAVGLRAEGYAKKNTPVDTGMLRNCTE